MWNNVESLTEIKIVGQFDLVNKQKGNIFKGND
jgi:hypothetical protein